MGKGISDVRENQKSVTSELAISTISNSVLSELMSVSISPWFLWGEKLILFRAIFWFESNYEKLMPEKIEEASECVELLIMQKQLTVTQKVISIKMVNWWRFR